ncbi:conjugal transfer protein TraG [Vibrio aestuarianus subsp. cardii]|uniref:conjugal transfer protein TraG N-terminal domain-containing protein n=1 Tax=Vibrio aestuarianus TaxID=28171 RepID=UPI001559F857|nr:conjugal transfer protein TraG N-terminal domain-containing protein [Vibrio aestuarianus]NGZ66578.1 conjugal transfer protein TraG [Vibrio aestuarianus subsp. cardii]
MIWDIVTFSNTATLNMVMNAMASIFGNGGYKSAAAALMLFVVGATVLGDMVKGGQELSFHKLFAGFIIYTAGFTTLTSVSIENRFNGTVERIDNIPIAVAVPASLISNMGLWLAETTETAFTPLNYTDIYKVTTAGYMTPLKTLVAYRQKAMDSYCGGGMDNSIVNGINLCKSVPYFVSECSMVKLSEQKSSERLYEDDFLNTLRFDSKAHATLLFDGANNSTIYDCQTASDLIINAFQSGNYATYLNSTTVVDYARAASLPLVDATEDIFSPHITYQSGQGRALMTAMFNHQLAEDGQYAFYSRTGSQDIAENLNSSIQQRNYGWALQGEMWYELVDKFMSVMEALIYALAPFIGLMLITGSLGQKTFLLYLQMLAVIQLIPMMLVVTQSVVLQDFNQAYLALVQDKNMNPGSINYAMAVSNLAFDKMGIGGMMAATVVPGMAMALVTGSGMALMGSIKGAAAAAKDTDAMPETHGQGGAIVNLGTRNTATEGQFGNQATQSYFTEIGDLKNSSAMKQVVSSAETAMTTAQQNYQTALKNTTQQKDGSAYSTEQIQSMSNSIMSSTDNTKSWQTSMQKTLQESTGLSETDASQLTGALALGLNMAGSGSRLSDNFTEGLSKEAKEVWQQIKSGTANDSITAGVRKMEQYVNSSGEKITTNNEYADQTARERQKTHQESVAATQKYEEAKSAERQFSMSNSDMLSNIHRKGMDDEVMNRANQFVREHIMSDPQRAQMFATKLDEYDGGVNANNMANNTALLSSLIATVNSDPNSNLQSEFLKDVWMDKPESFEVDSSAKNSAKVTNYTGEAEQTESQLNLKEPTDSTPKELTKAWGENAVKSVDEAYKKYAGEVNKSEEDSALSAFIASRKEAIENRDVYEDSNARGAYDALNDVIDRGPKIIIDKANEAYESATDLVASTVNSIGEWLGFAPESKEPVPEYMREIPDGDKMKEPVQHEGKTLTQTLADNTSANAAFTEVKSFFDSVGNEISNLNDEGAQKFQTFLSDMGYKGDSFQESLVNFAADTGIEGRAILQEAGILSNTNSQNNGDNNQRQPEKEILPRL